MELTREGDRGRIGIRMTTTAPGSPVGDLLVRSIERAP